MSCLFKPYQSDDDDQGYFFPSPASPSSKGLGGVRNDLSEIGGSLKSGLSFLASSRVVSHISKLTSSLLQFQDNEDEEDDDDYVAGITEEVVEFVMEISELPKTWIQFASSVKNQNFRMTSAQREHASTIEQIIPSLVPLRASLHSYMGNEQFWMLYFISLLPRLNEHDYEILSTPQIIETRNAFLQELENMMDEKLENSESSDTLDAYQEGSKVTETPGENIPSSLKESELVEAMEALPVEEEENKQKLAHEEAIRFSDLSTSLSNSPQAPRIRDPSPRSGDWIQLDVTPEPQSGSLQTLGSVTSDDYFSGCESYDFVDIDDCN